MGGSDHERPPKVKLSLRRLGLKPLAVKPSTDERSSSVEDNSYDSSSDEDSVSVDYSDNESQTAQVNEGEEEPWSLLPYPRRSISIPCYTPLQGYYLSTGNHAEALLLLLTVLRWDAEPLSRRSCHFSSHPNNAS
jgi:hypothetical protein